MLDTLKLDLSNPTPFTLTQLLDFTYKPSSTFNTSTFFHVIDDKVTSRKDHVIEFTIHPQNPLIIETNIDRQRKLRIIMVDDESNTFEAKYNERHVRVHHKSNIIVVKLETVEQRFKKIVLISEYGNKGEADKVLMNLSPTFDKKHPTLFRVKVEPRLYFKVS